MTETLIGERVGFEAVDDGVWKVYFATLPIALFDERGLVMRKVPQKKNGVGRCRLDLANIGLGLARTRRNRHTIIFCLSRSEWAEPAR